MNAAIEIIASDIKVERYAAETDRAFTSRVIYSASRFWAEAMCIDDGSDGTVGIAKQAFTRRLAKWVSRTEAVAAGVSAWFMSDPDGIPSLYNRLIDIGDIVEAGRNGELVARKPTVADTRLGCALLIGAHDFGKTENIRLGAESENLVTSGLLTIIMGGTSNEEELGTLPWLSDINCLSWDKVENYGDIEYVDTASTKWSLYNSSTWTQGATCFFEGFTLARRVLGEHQPVQFLLCRKASRSAKVSPISRDEAQELYFALRARSGNPPKASYEILDSKHIGLKAPIGFLPGRYNRYVDAASWPVDDISDNFNRVARIETLDLVRNALGASNVVLKGRQQ